MLKVMMKYGTAEILVEGEREETEAILGRFWEPILRGPVTATGGRPAEAAPVAAPRPRPRKQPQSRDNKANSDASENALANAVKTHASFSSFNKKIILVRLDWIRKCQMLIMVADRPLHSGTISRVLSLLGVKNSLPTISKTLTANKASFITGGTTPETYAFTAASREEFLTWLNSTDD